MRAVLLLYAAACGGAHEPEPTAISVTALASGAPVADADVWFQASDGSIITTAKTSANGVASAFVDDGATVSVRRAITIDGIPSEMLHTVVGARAGDTIVIDHPSETPPIRTVTFQLPALALGAASYALASPCNFTDVTPPTAVLHLAGCRDEIDFILVSYDDAYNAVDWLYRPPQPITGGEVIDLRAASLAPPAFVPVDIVNTAYERGSAIAKLGAVGLPSTAFVIANGGARTTARVPDVETAFAVETQLRFTHGGDQIVVLDWAPARRAIVIDGATLPGRLGQPRFDTSSITWPSDLDATVAEIHIGISHERIVHRRIITPVAGATVAFPKLPPGLADYELLPDDLPSIAGSIVRSTASYDELRPRYFDSRGTAHIAGTEGRSVIRAFGN